MRVMSTGGLPVSSTVWQSSTGAWALTLACKATFRLEPQEAVLAEQQEALNEDDNHWNDDPARSLVAPSDVVPFKTRADVVIVGHAFAPERTPVRSLRASITVGALHKELEVFCDRWFDLDGRVNEGKGFVKMPLRYERAAGGPDSANPVGMRFDADPDAYGRVPIPNLQPPGAHVGWRGDRFDPAGFGPVAPHWPSRRGKLRHHAARFSPRDWAKQPLPDVDFTFFNVAPRDQQLEAIAADERIAMEHLHRDHARLVTRLPGLHPRAVVDRAHGGREEIRLVADTLWIDTDRALCTVVWRGGIGLYGPEDAGTIHVIIEGLGRGSSAVGPGAVPGAGAVGAAVQTLPLPSPHVPEPVLVAKSDPETTLAPGLAPPGDTIPFLQSPWIESPYARSTGPEPRTDEAGATLFLSPTAADARATLPFPPRPASSFAAPDRAARERSVERPVREIVPTIPAPIAVDRPLVSLGSISLGNSAAELRPAMASPAPPRHGDEDTEVGLAPSKEAPAPPAMIGPLASPEMELPQAPPPEPTEEGAEVVAASLAPSAPAPPPKPSLQEYTVERCAKIAVAMACRPADAAKILNEHHLSEVDWDYVKNHCLESIRQELGRGQNALLKRYDHAYVDQLEAERGPIGAEEYAQILVASERGRTREVTVQLGLPAGAPMRIERFWTEKMVRDHKLSEQVRAAIERRRQHIES